MISSAKSFDNDGSSSRAAEDGKSHNGSDQTPSRLTSLLDVEERGTIKK